MAGNLTQTAQKNFIVMLLYRLDTLLSRKKRGVNIIGIKTDKPREYIFYRAAASLGNSVLLLPPSCSSVVSEYARRPNNAAAAAVSRPMPNVTIPRRTSASNNTTPTVQRRELSYEEIARLSSSIVQIFVINDPNDIAPNGSVRSGSGGSGVMISKDGYILTNHHVVRGGRVYGVRVENEKKIYFTNRIIKYHDNYDLALIRIDRRLSPLPVYRGAKPLVRGQRVAAIGSPLGLFNTVSDGIISGFRDVDGVNMIQFTAPISPGSSGGAVLNMSGEVIGISSAGLDTEGGQAQNINLAVGYDTVLSFCGNIIDK
ncbi:MAG: serine protease [Clostridia bacterium]|nr:serine protease [Clostridia bacterium]